MEYTITKCDRVKCSVSSSGCYQYIESDLVCNLSGEIESKNSRIYDNISFGTYHTPYGMEYFITQACKPYGWTLFKNEEGTHFVVVAKDFRNGLAGRIAFDGDLSSPSSQLSQYAQLPTVNVGVVPSLLASPRLQPYIVDFDGDLYHKCDDCDDNSPNVFPGALEICNDGVANDCSNSQSADCDNPACAENEACLASGGDIPPEKHPRDCRLNVTY